MGDGSQGDRGMRPTSLSPSHHERSEHSPSSAYDAAKSDVVGAGVDRVGHTRGGTVALAIVLGTGPRSALEHLARDTRPVRVGIDTRLPAATARIDRGATAGAALFVPRGGPVGRPLPGIADHVGEPIAVRRE